MVDEAKKIITVVRQMETSLDDSKNRRDYQDDEDLTITYPLVRCLQALKEKHSQISRIHKERFEQVKSMFPVAFSPVSTRTDNPLRRARTSPRILLLTPRSHICPDRAPSHRPQSVHPSQLRSIPVLRRQA